MEMRMARLGERFISRLVGSQEVQTGSVVLNAEGDNKSP